MGEVQAENKKLVEPLQKAQDQVSDLQRQLFSYEKDKALLAVRKFYFLLYATHKKKGRTQVKVNSLSRLLRHGEKSQPE